MLLIGSPPVATYLYHVRLVDYDETHAMQEKNPEIPEERVGFFECADDDRRAIVLNPRVCWSPVNPAVQAGDNDRTRRNSTQVF